MQKVNYLFLYFFTWATYYFSVQPSLDSNGRWYCCMYFCCVILSEIVFPIVVYNWNIGTRKNYGDKSYKGNKSEKTITDSVFSAKSMIKKRAMLAEGFSLSHREGVEWHSAGPQSSARENPTFDTEFANIPLCVSRKRNRQMSSDKSIC